MRGTILAAIGLAVILAGPFLGAPAAAQEDGAGAAAEPRGADPIETATSALERSEMVYRIEVLALALEEELGGQPFDERVIVAMARVPRHYFVPPALRPLAYQNRPLPVSADQNIAQPIIIALMTHMARVAETDVVFETGTGVGYHAAILAELAAEVYSVEVGELLAAEAEARLERLGYANVHVRAGDGYYGWREHGPYDVIMIKEALDHVPPPLLAQLKPGGRMVVPLGPLHGTQMLTLVEKAADGSTRQRGVLEVRFSPMQGGDRV